MLSRRRFSHSSKLDGTGYPELAARVGKSVDAVKKMVSRAMQRLRTSAADGVARPI